MASAYGPSGGPGGSEFRIWPPIEDGFTLDTTPFEIAGLIFNTGSYIDAMQVIYRNVQTGDMVVSDKVGGNGGMKAPPFELAQDEYITNFLGWAGDYVNSLAVFIIGLSQPVVFGSPETTTNFEYTWEPTEEVIGFWGRSGAYIDAIGVLVRHRPSR